MERARAEDIARLFGGSMATAAALADPEASEQREQFVSRALAALEVARSRATRSTSRRTRRGRDKDLLTRQIEALVAALGAEARARASRGRAGAPTSRRRVTGSRSRPCSSLEGNASAQLAVEAMLLRMRIYLVRPVEASPGRTSYSLSLRASPVQASGPWLPATTSRRSGPEAAYSATMACAPTDGAPVPMRATLHGQPRERS